MNSEKFIILGQKHLAGEIGVLGCKNAAGPALAATLLTDEECIIDNLPLVEDVFNLIEILKSLGAQVEWIGERKLKIRAAKIEPEKMDFERIPRTRISVLLIGPLLTRFEKFKFSHPGGDRIGLRPILTHLEVFKKLGVEIREENEFYYFSRKNLKGKEILLKEFSVTATETLMMAAVKAQGKTKILGAACEPHVQDLAKMLKSMGAKIEGAGTHDIEIEGVEKLKGTEHKIIFDPIEAGTFIVIGALTGEVLVKNVNPSHLALFLAKMEDIGVNFEKGQDFVKVKFSPELRSTNIQALPYPGFPTDLLPPVLPLLTQAKGKSLIHDPLYENRLNYVQELKKMGADIEIVDPHRAIIFGKTPLRGLRIEAWDIRAGASLVAAGLIASGQTIIDNIYQIDRGYEKIEERLQKIGADIKRVKS